MTSPLYEDLTEAAEEIVCERRRISDCWGVNQQTEIRLCSKTTEKIEPDNKTDFD